MMKLRTTVVIYLLLLSCSAAAQGTYPPRANGELIEHCSFTLSYIESAEQAEWVYYELTPAMVDGVAKRRDNFREDSAVSTRSAQLKDYKDSGFDRGHLSPAASMRHSQIAISESFLMSNISPQRSAFNRGGWRKLEEQVRDWVRSDSLIYVVTGPILSDEMERIGENNVAVPNHFYKAIYSPRREQMIAFLMPNDKIDQPLAHYAVSVEQIEAITQIDLFYSLPDSVERNLESTMDIKLWSLD